MSQRILRTVVFLVAVTAVQAEAGDGPDLRSILSDRKHRTFTGRIVGVTARPEPVMRLGSRGDAKLLEAVSYWLRVGREYEARLSPRLAELRRRQIVFSTSSLYDVFYLTFENRRGFNEIDLQAWSNIALAVAVSGDYREGAQILEGLADILVDQQSLVSASDYALAERIRSDADALWIQHSESQDDTHTLLDHLHGKVFIPFRRDRMQSARDINAATYFNEGLILEKLGLHGPAIECYRRSLQLSDDDRWNEETVRRIDRLSQPSRKARWLDVRARLAAASRGSDPRAVRNIVGLFPEHARIATEKEFLAVWARGALVGGTGEGTYHLRIARSIGAARRDLYADSLLADTVRMIDQSILENDARRIESLARGFLLYEQAGAAETFDDAAAAFDVAGSPMANVARFLAIMTRFDAVHIDESLEQLRQLHRAIPFTHRTLRAMVDGAIGNCLAERGELEAALETYTGAQRMFETLGEADSVASMRTSAAHMLTLLGDPAEAWRVRLPALRMAEASGNLALVEFVLRHVASDELFERRGRALTLYSSMLPVPPLYASPGVDSRSSRWRESVPLYSKQVMIDAVSGRPLPAQVRNDLRVAQAISLYQRMPEQAEALLSESIAFAEATGRVAMLPYVYFYRAIARCETKRGKETIRDLNVYYDAIGRCDATREDDAIHDLTSATSLLEARRRNTVRRDLRDRWDRVADDALHELMNLHWDRGDDSALFVLGERRRGRVFLDGVTAATAALEALTAEGIAERLEPGIAVIVFTASSTRLRMHPLATVIEKDRVAMHRVTMPPGNVYFRAEKLRVAIDEDRPLDVQSLAEELYELLIQPLGIDSDRIQRLVIVADHPLHDIPFALLQDRRSCQSLIEQFELMRAPSASVFAQMNGAVLTELRSVLAVGDPAFDRNAYPSFSSLPAARSEAVAIGRQYPQSRTLIGRHGTLENLASSVPTADVIHIAAHTASSGKEREVLKLLLAPSRQHAGACSVGEAADLPVKKGSIVVVPGCQTGTSRAPGVLRDFAGAFLAAGARNVVATLWDIEDYPSRTFALLFHRALRRCGSAVTATREAQLAMLRSANASIRHPRAWSGFQVYGTGHERTAHNASPRTTNPAQ